MPLAENTVISTVIPSYNHARFVETAIASVLAQQVPNLELIVVDDGSTDGSVALLEKLSEQHGFQLITQANQGAHHAINRGLQECRGDYLAILNSDDVFEEGRLRYLLREAQETGVSFLYTRVEFVNSLDQPIPTHRRAKTFARVWKQTADYSGSENFLRTNPAVTSSNFFFRKDLWEKVGKFRNLRYTHDWDWVLRAGTFTELKRLEMPLLRYRIHADNTISERSTWRKICEDSFIFASHINRAGFGQSQSLQLIALHRFFDILLENENFLPYPTLLLLGLIRGGSNEDELLESISGGILPSQIEQKALSRGLPVDLFLSTDRFRRFLVCSESLPAKAKSFRKSLQLRIGRLLRMLASRVEGR